MSFRISITPSRQAGARFVAAARREIQKALADEEARGGITQSDIARAIGVNRSVISREVRGHADISIGRVAEIAWALGRRPKLVIEEATAPQGSNAPMPAAPALNFKVTNEAANREAQVRAPDAIFRL